MDLFWAFGTMTATAHAQVDEDGYTYNIGTSYICGTKYAIIRFDPETKPGKSVQYSEPHPDHSYDSSDSW